MEIEGREGQSVFLRGWGDYQRYSLKLTESETSGMRMLGLRAWSEEALQRRVAAVEATGRGRAGPRATAAAARPTASATPTTTSSSCTTSASATRRPSTCARR